MNNIDYKQVNESAIVYNVTDNRGIEYADILKNMGISKSEDLFYVTPEMFGAVGDGKTDDTEAVRKALKSGKNVSFGAGKTYIIKKVLTLSPKVKHNFNNCTLKKVGIVGQSMLQLDNVSDYTIENVNFVDDSISRSGFIKGHNVNGLTIRNVNITATSLYSKDKPGNWSMSLSGKDITIDNVHLDSSMAGKWADGIHFGYCEKVNIKNSYFYTGDDCIAIHQHPNNTGALVNKKSRDITIDNCTLKSVMANGIRLGLTYKGSEDFSKVGVDNLHVTNCTIGAVENLSFKDCNFIRNYAGSNAYLYVKGKSVKFDNVSVVDNGKNTDKSAVNCHAMLLKCDKLLLRIPISLTKLMNIIN